MPSRKKNRGKQRKERQELARKGCHELDDPYPPVQQMVKEFKEMGFRIEKRPDGSTNFLHPGFTEKADPERWAVDREILNDAERGILADNYVHNYAQELREGGFDGTRVILKNLADPHLGPKLSEALVGVDIHQSMLHFLNQADKSVYALLQNGCSEQESIAMPSMWVELLKMIAQQDTSCSNDTRLALAKGIQPFLMRMIDHKRELFGANMIWHLCLPIFFDLIFSIMLSNEGLMTILSYDGFLTFVAQASCLRQSRDDIIEEARIHCRNDLDTISLVCDAAQRVLLLVIDEHDMIQNAMEIRGGQSFPDPLEVIAWTPLLSNDPECTDSTMVGLVRMLNMDSNQQDHDLLTECIIEPMLLTHGYVDAQVIAQLIEYGRGNSSIKAAQTVLDLMLAILGRDDSYEHIQPSDTRYAAAIRLGLLEFCIDAHKLYDVLYGDEDECEFAEGLYFIAYGLYSMSLHKETSRALRDRKAEILSAVEVLSNSSSSQTKMICTLINEALKSGTPTCCNCLKEFDRKNLRFCERCNIECYCSTTCQSESYAFHRKFCKEKAIESNAMMREGVAESEIKIESSASVAT